jgi:predicted nucleic acid-binding protein
MASLVFFDSNILVYADDLLRGEADNGKRSLGAACRRRDGCRIAGGTTGVFRCGNPKLGIAADQAQERVRVMAEGPMVCFETKYVLEAIDLHRLRQISFWDALIVHAARSAGAAVFYSEDLQHGAVLGGVRIENPFVVHG